MDGHELGCLAVAAELLKLNVMWFVVLSTSECWKELLTTTTLI